MSSFAQLRLALAGGPHFSSITEKNSIPGWESKYKPGYSNRNGFNVGVMADIPLGTNNRLFLQPGIFYMTKGRKYAQVYDTTAAQTDSLSMKHSFFPNYIDVPLNLTYKLPLGKKNKFFLSAGPYIGFFYTGKQITETRLVGSNNSVKFKKDEVPIEAGNAIYKVKTIDYGLNARVGFELGSFLVTGYMSQGLNNFYKAPYDGTFKHRVMGISIGFWLNKAQTEERKLRDRDKDGVPDQEDACPRLAGSIAANGCPDKDNDGVADTEDKCPTVAGSIRYNGCPPPDSDNDGVNDVDDKCPNVPGLIRYNGCPVPDTDKDGMNDEEDKCPTVAGPASNNGCPIPDTDGDGINDQEDKCPSIPGTIENNGCPVIKEEIVAKVNYIAKQIFFARNSDRLSRSSLRALNEVVSILKKNPQLVMAINGHSDNTGNAELNLLLSQKRANAVKRFLVTRGISKIRLEATGYGQTQPVDNNETLEGRAKNRRVELRLATEWSMVRAEAPVKDFKGRPGSR